MLLAAESFGVNLTSDGGVSFTPGALLLFKWLGVAIAGLWAAWANRDKLKAVKTWAASKVSAPADSARRQETSDYHATLDAFDLVIRETLSQSLPADTLFTARAEYQTRFWRGKSPTMKAVT